jgi:hypothetical protein
VTRSSSTGSSAATPIERAKHPRMPNREPGTVWTIAQLQAFLATARQHQLFAFFHLAAYTGARRGELLNLRWADVDLDAKKITISGSTAVIAGERINGTTKSVLDAPRPASVPRVWWSAPEASGSLALAMALTLAACPFARWSSSPLWAATPWSSVPSSAGPSLASRVGRFLSATGPAAPKLR